MSREAYNSLPNIGTRGSPGNRTRRLTELPQVDRSPSRDFQRGSPLGKPFTKIHHQKKNFYKPFTKFVQHAKNTYIHIYFHSSLFNIKLNVITYLLSLIAISTSTFPFLFSHTNFIFPPLTHCNFVI